jgi:cytidine deaminase
MIDPLEYPEVVFGICSPIGVDNRLITEIISAEMRYYNYEYHKIKITDIMKDIKVKGAELKERPFDERYDTYIKYANKIRELFGLPSSLAVLSCIAIKSKRREINEKSGREANSYLERMCYIVDQLKRPEEVSLLRQIYGRLFILISVTSDDARRLQVVSNRIAADLGDGRPTEEDISSARLLMARDQDEGEVTSGQRLRDAFALADLFVDIDNRESAQNSVGRFLKGFFGSNAISPTRDEYGMYTAKGAALRSMDLSRQVGAAIFSVDGEVVTQGCNEVPKAGGGTYWSGDSSDFRDYVLGRDENERIKRSLLVDVVRVLGKGGYLKEDKGSDKSLIERVVDESYVKGSPIRNMQLMDILEFGRIIHAEMSAICDAARLGRSIKDGILYCTTFPCHICSKHIVASGIRRVVYIEPYPKSYAINLHSDSISVQGDCESKKVIYSPFIGISPYRYREIFERGKRKGESGEFMDWSGGEIRPIVKYNIANWLANEVSVIKYFGEIAEELALKGAIEYEMDTGELGNDTGSVPEMTDET